MPSTRARALVFDVFGTVVDWRSSVIAEGEALGRAKSLQVDWSRFADEWRVEGYRNAIASIRSGQLPWTRVDTMHRRKLDELLVRHGISGLSEAEIADFNRVWHRLRGWPDTVEGLTRLKRKFIISTLSNGDFALLTNMAKHSGLPWDCIITSELVGKFKPEPEVYQTAARLLDLQHDEVMLVAAHVADLQGAQRAGLRAAFVSRPKEHGPAGSHEPDPDPSFDYVATSFLDLADQLGT